MHENERRSIRKQLKKAAKATVKRHYVVLVALCIVALFLGVEFAFTSNWIDAGSVRDVAVDNIGIFQRYTANDVVTDILNDNIEASSETSRKIEEQLLMDDSSRIRGRTRGVLATIVNALAAGKGYIFIAGILHTIFKNGVTATFAFILLVGVVWLFVLIFLLGVYRVMMRRVFLEARTYKKIPFSHFIHFNSVRQWVHVALSLLLLDIYQILWTFTIVGGIIKYFSYLMVPYIIAENPDIKARDAIKLSRQMMNGHKWEMFCVQISFLGWMILGGLTFGISDLIWYLPYRTATTAEYYTRFRMLAKAAHIPNSEQLDDVYLFRQAEQEKLREAYASVYEEIEDLDAHPVKISKKQAFFAKTFALWIGSTKKKRAYQEHLLREHQVRTVREILDGESYPARLGPRYIHRHAIHFVRKTHYLRCYTVWSALAIFFALSFIGWCWEVSLHLVEDGVFINRGSLHGPWLPIYGVGSLLILITLARFRENPAIEFILAIVVSGCVEYATSYYMQFKFGMRWWDYSGYYLNLNGRICAEGLFVFAVGGGIVVYMIAPMIDAWLSQWNIRYIISVLLVLSAIFIMDAIYSGQHPNTGDGITNYDVPERNVRSLDLPRVNESHRYYHSLLCVNVNDRKERL